MRKIKADAKREGRVETGALQIDDDWAGLFVRGDDCMMLRFILEDYLNTGTEFSSVGQAWFAERLLEEIEDAHGKVGKI